MLAVMADGEAPALVDRAHRLHAAIGGRWSVVALDTPEAERRGDGARAVLLAALERAERLGAATARISAGVHATSGTVSALVHRAQAEGVTDLMVGRSRLGGLAGTRGQRLSQFVDVLGELLPGVAVHAVVLPGSAAPAPAAGPRARRWRFGGGALVLAVLALCTGLAALLQPLFHSANLVMVYLAGVVFVAARRGRAAALATVLGAIFLYDLLFVAPRWGLKPTDAEHWIAFAVMLAAGLVVSGLAAQGRDQAAIAEARARRAGALADLARALARTRQPQAVGEALAEAVRRALGIDCRLLDAGALDAPAAPLGDAPVDTACARAALEAGAPRTGAHGLRYLPLAADGAPLGVVVLPPFAPGRASLEDEHLAHALVNQAAVALERARFEQRSIDTAIATERERLRSTLLAGVSHDFRTPLTTIMGNATTLLDQGAALDETRRSALLRALLAEAERLHALSSNLLDLTRLEEGAVRPAPEWVPADELVGEGVAALGPRLAGHRLELRTGGGTPVWCDPRLVGQVVVNLLDNAVRHTPAGGRIRVAVEPGAGFWRLVVHDDGPGVPPGQETRVFEKFHRARGDADAAGKGLGLAICAAVAALHGGTIVVANDGGARFVMTLPQPAAPPALDEAACA